MTGSPVLAVAEAREPQAEAVIHLGLAAYNTTRFRPSDNTTLDILVLAEDEARRRGCTAAFVYTVTFQAPEFYERHGYSRFGEIACPPDGATRIFLSKALV